MLPGHNMYTMVHKTNVYVWINDQCIHLENVWIAFIYLCRLLHFDDQVLLLYLQNLYA